MNKREHEGAKARRSTKRNCLDPYFVFLRAFAPSCSLLLLIYGARAKDVTVATDGTGDFKSVQAAVDSIPAKATERVVVHVKPGVYKERVAVRKDKGPVTFLGEGDPKNTVLTWNYSAKSQDN